MIKKTGANLKEVRVTLKIIIILKFKFFYTNFEVKVVTMYVIKKAVIMIKKKQLPM